MRTDSIKTGGELVLGLSCAGLTDASPLVVENQSVPSAPRHAPGWQPEVHSLAGNPSACPYERKTTGFVEPEAGPARSLFFARIKPAVEPIHKLPDPSSSK